MKATVQAPPNIAFIKYWGARDLARAIPANPSLSMTLSRSYSWTTVEFRPGGDSHEVWQRTADGRLEPAPASFAGRVESHLDRLVKWAGVAGSCKVATTNNFPAAAGIASSASGFAALALATAGALGRTVSTAEASILARLSGSGSAARSVLGGYVEWPAVGARPDSPAVEVAPAEHWDLRDVIAVVESGPKSTSSLDGHRRARTSPYWPTRQAHLPERLAVVRQAVLERDFSTLATVLEEEAIDLHVMAMTSRPPIFYWAPGTLEILAAVRALRADGVPAASTIDAGANVHVICPAVAEPFVVKRLEAVDSVRRLIRDRVGAGPVSTDQHLF